MSMYGFRCQECHKGTVRAETRKDYPVKIQRIPFVVPKATIGVCDNCGAEYFDGSELKRWRKVLEEQQERTGGLMSAAEIRELRERLGMNMSDFAALIGATRQSLYHWEKDDREAVQSRMVDLMLRLVREGVRAGSVDVVGVLHQAARDAGVDIAPRRIERPALDACDRRHRGRVLRFPDRPTFDGLFQSTAPSTEPTLSPRLKIAA